MAVVVVVAAAAAVVVEAVMVAAEVVARPAAVEVAAQHCKCLPDTMWDTVAPSVDPLTMEAAVVLLPSSWSQVTTAHKLPCLLLELGLRYWHMKSCYTLDHLDSLMAV